MTFICVSVNICIDRYPSVDFVVYACLNRTLFYFDKACGFVKKKTLERERGREFGYKFDLKVNFWPS